LITSPANPLVKELVRLRKRRHRDSEGLFLIEGARQVMLAVAAGTNLIHQIIAPELGGEPLAPGVRTTEMAAGPFRKASARQNPDGVLAIATQLATRLDLLDPPRPCVLLAVESVEKPGNLGAILRTADALGVDGVVVADAATDIHNPNVVQASQGALFSVPIGVGTTSEVIEWLGHHDIALVATTPTGRRPLWEVDLTGSVAIAIGAESVGLSPAFLAAADRDALIPMEGMVDSLNASVTAAIALYEALRQRGQD
jgi:TrmH family RNA methyltransferase